ncbi:MAG: hypothetical protein ACYCQJ_05210 [Nitrososphaerales archaeon]
MQELIELPKLNNDRAFEQIEKLAKRRPKRFAALRKAGILNSQNQFTDAFEKEVHKEIVARIENGQITSDDLQAPQGRLRAVKTCTPDRVFDLHLQVIATLSLILQTCMEKR